MNETNALSFILVNIIFLVGTFTFAVVLGVVSDDITTEVKVRVVAFLAHPPVACTQLRLL